MLNKELRMSSNTIVSNCCEAEFETVDLEMEVCGSCYQVADQYDPIEDEPSYLDSLQTTGFGKNPYGTASDCECTDCQDEDPTLLRNILK
jgi:hypothetical protein|tara:strand:- start:202 stop:471 length:270 start_codon:yes stop_codon:yes gene_type:complete